ncbi:MAG: hypothetical protein ABJR05_00635 [Balneola sp.]
MTSDKQIKHLKALFEKRASWTSNIIEKGLSTRLGIMEESITDYNLLSIQQNGSGFIMTKKFSRREEGSISGADWLWLIGEPGSWIPIIIQAKVINPKTLKCNQINYKGGDQNKKLISYSRKNKLLPYYCLYSYIPKDFPTYYFGAPMHHKNRASIWGCSLQTPKQIKSKIKRDELKAPGLLRGGFPWSYMFEQTSNTLQLGKLVSERLAKLRNDIDTIENFMEKPNTLKSSRVDWHNPNPIDLVVEEVPSFFENLLKERYRSKKSPVTNIGIISSVPISEIDNKSIKQLNENHEYIENWTKSIDKSELNRWNKLKN